MTLGKCLHLSEPESGNEDTCLAELLGASFCSCDHWPEPSRFLRRGVEVGPRWKDTIWWWPRWATI